MPPRSKIVGHFVFVLSQICNSVWYLLITFQPWLVELWYFTWVFHVPRPFVVTKMFYLVTLTLGFELLFENFSLANNFWKMSAKTLTRPFHEHKFLTYVLKNLTLLITFQPIVLEVWYIIWVYHVIRSFCWF